MMTRLERREGMTEEGKEGRIGMDEIFYEKMEGWKQGRKTFFPSQSVPGPLISDRDVETFLFPCSRALKK